MPKRTPKQGRYIRAFLTVAGTKPRTEHQVVIADDGTAVVLPAVEVGDYSVRMQTPKPPPIATEKGTPPMTTVPESVRAVRVPILEELLPFYRLCADESLVHTVVVATIHLDDDAFAFACRRALTHGDHRNPIREILEAAAALRRPASAKT